MLSLAWNQLSSSYPTSCIAVGWMTPTPSQDPPIPQEGGGLMLWPWPWQGGWGGDPEPGTYILYIDFEIQYLILIFCRIKIIFCNVKLGHNKPRRVLPLFGKSTFWGCHISVSRPTQHSKRTVDQKFPPRRPPGKGGSRGWVDGKWTQFCGEKLTKLPWQIHGICSIFIPTGTWLILMVVPCRYIWHTWMVCVWWFTINIPIIWDFPPRKGGDE